MSDVDEHESLLQRELGAPLVDAHERQTPSNTPARRSTSGSGSSSRS